MHNIYGSEPGIPDGMLDTSKPLPPEFFINPRCPWSTALGIHTTDPDTNVEEAGKSLPVVEVGLESLIRITVEDEKPDASSGN